MKSKKAIVLLSGGLDSATALYIARQKGFNCSCLIFDYGQRQRREIESAKKIARSADCKYKVVKIDLPWKGSALLDSAAKIPVRANAPTRRNAGTIPSTYVPARNIIFLSLALSYAEAIGAHSIFIGAHSQDYSGYPDCRPEFFRAFKEVISRGTKAGAEKRLIRIEAPLIHKSKSEIIKSGSRLGVPFGLTWSCYKGGRKPCGVCDSCYYRKKGFKQAGINER
jgi:7-cyano-7-deazaguanine synthase